jgi:hypothetical protein
MNKSLVLITLFLGVMVSANKTEAFASKANDFKELRTLQNSPFDPRQGARDEKSETSDDTGRDDLPQQQQAEE